jgi:hypothetical protein
MPPVFRIKRAFTLKFGAAESSETFVPLYQSAQRHMSSLQLGTVMRISENGVLKRKFGPEMDEVSKEL